METSTCSTKDHQDKQGGPFAQLAEAVCINFEENRKAWGPHLFQVDITQPSDVCYALARKVSKAYANEPDHRLHNISELLDHTGRGLWLLFLSNLPEDEIRHHNCNCCRNFFKRFGDLCFTNEQGQLIPAFWGAKGDVPEIYQRSVRALYSELQLAGKIVGVKLWSDKTPWGDRFSGGWEHFSVIPFTPNHSRRDLDVHAAEALKKEDFGTLRHGLADFDLDTCKQALTLLQADALYRGEKFVGPAEFLIKLHNQLNEVKDRRKRDHVIWLSVASAPVGWATPRSGMIGTLLSDIKMGLSFDTIRTRFTAKMHPLEYQRPQAKPTVGNIKVAEKRFAELGLSQALERRYAKLEEVQKIWLPRFRDPQPAAEGSVFGHLETKSKDQGRSHKPVEMTKPTPMTWSKFRSTVLPNAVKMEVKPMGPLPFCGLLTAVHPNSPPMFQWDYDDARNQFNWYFYNGGSYAGRWNLSEGMWVDVTGVCLLPNQWDERRNYGEWKGAVFILRDCQETQVEAAYIYPGIMRSDLHDIRPTIEQFNKQGRAVGNKEGTANGICMGGSGGEAKTPIRVTTDMGVSLYLIDRWD